MQLMMPSQLIQGLERGWRRVARTGVHRGLPPSWFGYRWVDHQTVPEYFARHGGPGRAGRYQTLHPECVALNPLPCNVGSPDELPDERGWWGFSFRDVPARTSCETFIATIPNCRIVCYRDPEKANDFYPAILSGDGRALDLRETRFRPPHAQALRRSGRPVRLGKATWILERVYDNHAHWLTGHMPKLLLLRQRGELAGVLLPPPAERTGAIDASIRMLGLEPQQFQTFDLARPLEVERLTILGTDRFRPELLRLVPQSFGALDASPPHRRIFISRSKASRRRLVNESEIWTLLESAGFERIHMEELTFEQQVALMRQTAVLLALHGAGMSNMMFCPPGIHVVEIADPGYPSPNVYAVAAAMRHHYWLLAGEPVAHDLPQDAAPPGWRDLRIDPSAVRRILDCLPARVEV